MRHRFFMQDATGSIQIQTIMGADTQRMGMLDACIAKMLQDIRLQNNASATAIHCRGGALENIDLPANRPQRRGGKQAAQ